MTKIPELVAKLEKSIGWIEEIADEQNKLNYDYAVSLKILSWSLKDQVRDLRETMKQLGS